MNISDSYLIIIPFLCIVILPFVASWPAYKVLKRKNYLFKYDYFLAIYLFILYVLLSYFFQPFAGPQGVSNFIVETICLVVLIIIITYLKLLFVGIVSPRKLSNMSILLLVLLTILLFFFTPMFGE